MIADRRFFYKLGALSILMLLPLWGILALMWPVHDDYFIYAFSVSEFSREFWQGNLYPRWLTQLNNGLGAPVFLIYGPLAFYATTLLEPLSLIDPYGFGRLLIGLSIMIFLSGISALVWFRMLFTEKKAKSAALLYAAFPFSLYVIYLSFALAQSCAIALMPLCLAAAHRLTKNKKHSGLFMCFSFALLLFAHPPTFMAFALLPVVYATFFSPSADRIRNGFTALAALIFSCLLAGIYLFPALLNKSFILDAYYLSRVNYAHNFTNIRSLIGQLLVTLPLVGLLIEARKKHPIFRNQTIIALICLLAGLTFLVLPLSKPIWDHIPLMHYLQYPARFFIAMMPFAVWLASLCLEYARTRYIYHGLFVASMVIFPLVSSQTAFYPTRTDVVKSIHENRLTAGGAHAYYTIWMPKAEVENDWELSDRYLKMPEAAMIKGQGNAKIINKTARKIELETDVQSKTATVSLKRFYYPGWIADLPAAKIFEQDALLTLEVPQGSHHLTLSLPWFPGEKEGMIASLLALAACVVLWFKKRV